MVAHGGAPPRCVLGVSILLPGWGSHPSRFMLYMSVHARVASDYQEAEVIICAHLWILGTEIFVAYQAGSYR